MQLKTIPLHAIAGSVYQLRLQEDRELRGLMGSVATNELRLPIVVLERDRAYHVVCRHRRLRALAGLVGRGMTELPAGQAALSNGKVTVNALVTT